MLLRTTPAVDVMLTPILYIRELRNRLIKKLNLELASFSSKMEQDRLQVIVQGTFMGYAWKSHTSNLPTFHWTQFNNTVLVNWKGGCLWTHRGKWMGFGKLGVVSTTSIKQTSVNSCLMGRIHPHQKQDWGDTSEVCNPCLIHSPLWFLDSNCSLPSLRHQVPVLFFRVACRLNLTQIHYCKLENVKNLMLWGFGLWVYF